MDAPRIALLVVDAFVALTAVGGGLSLLARLARPPLDWLSGTPFKSYLIPGSILASAVGGSALAATVAVVFDSEIGAAASAVAGAILIGWIAGEYRILRQSSWLQALYLGAGLLMVVFAAIVWRAS